MSEDFVKCGYCGKVINEGENVAYVILGKLHRFKDCFKAMDIRDMLWFHEACFLYKDELNEKDVKEIMERGDFCD